MPGTRQGRAGLPSRAEIAAPAGAAKKADRAAHQGRHGLAAAGGVSRADAAGRDAAHGVHGWPGRDRQGQGRSATFHPSGFRPLERCQPGGAGSGASLGPASDGSRTAPRHHGARGRPASAPDRPHRARGVRGRAGPDPAACKCLRDLRQLTVQARGAARSRTWSASRRGREPAERSGRARTAHAVRTPRACFPRCFATARCDRVVVEKDGSVAHRHRQTGLPDRRGAGRCAGIGTYRAVTWSERLHRSKQGNGRPGHTGRVGRAPQPPMACCQGWWTPRPRADTLCRVPCARAWSRRSSSHPQQSQPPAARPVDCGGGRADSGDRWCETGTNAPTQEWHQPTAGASAVVSDTMRIDDMFVLLGRVPGLRLPAVPRRRVLRPEQQRRARPADQHHGARLGGPGSGSAGGIQVGRDQSLLLTGPQPRVLLKRLTRTLHGGQYVRMDLNSRARARSTLRCGLCRGPRSRRSPRRPGLPWC